MASVTNEELGCTETGILVSSTSLNSFFIQRGHLQQRAVFRFISILQLDTQISELFCDLLCSYIR